MAAKFFTGLPLDGPDPECVPATASALLDRPGEPRRSAATTPRPIDSRRQRRRRRPTGRATRTRSPTARRPRSRRRGQRDGQQGWFESVAEAQRRAKKRLPKSVYGALVAGSERGRHARRQRRRVRRARLRAARRRPVRRARPRRPPCMGQPISLPVIDLADRRAGRAPRRRGRRRARGRGARAPRWASARSPASRSRRSSRPTRRRSSRCTGRARASASCSALERARAAGAVGLIVTLDWSFSHGRDWGSPAIPEQIDLQARCASSRREALARPRWLLDCLRRPAARPTSPSPNLAAPGEPRADVLRRLRRVDADAAARRGTDVAWLREQWDGPFMLKGVMRVDDARRAVDAGVDAISVSNHGGNNLDGTPAPIRALPAIADAVGDQVEVAARRRHPPRQRRRQGARARRPGGDDRPRLPLGPGRQRPGRRRERPRHPAQRHRLGAAGPRPSPRCTTSAPTTSLVPARVRAPRSACRTSSRRAVRSGEARLARLARARARVARARARRPGRAPPSSTARTCRWRPTPTIAVALADAARPRRDDVVVGARRCRTAPAASTRASRARCRSASEALELLVVELVRSATGRLRGGSCSSAHGGNAEPLRARGRAAARRGTPTSRAGCRRHGGGDPHAGRTETSLMLAHRPGARRRDARPVGATEPLGRAAARVARASGVQGGVAQRRARRRPRRLGGGGPRAVARSRGGLQHVRRRRAAGTLTGMSGAVPPPADLEVCLEPVGPRDGARPDPHRRLAVPDAARHRRRRRSDRSLAPSRADRRPGRLPRARPAAAGRRHARPAPAGRHVHGGADGGRAGARPLGAARALPRRGARRLPGFAGRRRRRRIRGPAAVRAVGDARGARVVRQPVSRGAAAARNAGLAACATAYVGFVDSDVVLPPSAPSRLLGHFADPRVAAVAPRIRALQPGGGLIGGYEERHSALDMGSARRPGRSRPADARTCRAPCCSSAASAVGRGFDESLIIGEDVDFVWRLGGAGWHVRYAPEAEAWHDHRVRLGEFVARRYLYARSVGMLARRHPDALPAMWINPQLALPWALAGRRPAVGARRGRGRHRARRLPDAPPPGDVAGTRRRARREGHRRHRRRARSRDPAPVGSAAAPRRPAQARGTPRAPCGARGRGRRGCDRDAAAAGGARRCPGAAPRRGRRSGRYVGRLPTGADAPAAPARLALAPARGFAVSRVAIVTGAARGIGAATVARAGGAAVGASSRSIAARTTRACRTRSAPRRSSARWSSAPARGRIA